KRLVESKNPLLDITIFEKKDEPGPGMPYSDEGACREHVTNVSDNEIPSIISHMKEWINTASPELLNTFDMKPATFNEYKVVPRLFFGEYLSAQFKLLLNIANQSGIVTNLIRNTSVTNMEDNPEEKKVKVYTGNDSGYEFDLVVICTGHTWPKKHEGEVEGWFDSPYPPSKLNIKTNYPVAIRGASLTALDAVKTLARQNGTFIKNEDHSLTYIPAEDSIDFKLVLHSIHGLLPGIRFHLEDPHLSVVSEFTEEEANKIMEANEGFIPLDYMFKRNFIEPLRLQKPAFYEQVKDMDLESLVTYLMDLRLRLDAFVLFKAEYAEAEKSIKRHQSVYWKEMLATLSYALNYPAKHMSAEDMLRLKKILMPLISIVIAFVPQSSCRELIALYDAGVLDIISVDHESKVEPGETGGAIYTHKSAAGEQQDRKYKMFIDAIGQAPVMYEHFPFEGLKRKGTVSEAFFKFKNAEAAEKESSLGNKQVIQITEEDFYLKVPGININDHFQVLDKFGAYNNRIYVMAVPLIAGLNPDYSGLDFCETASGTIVKSMFNEKETTSD
ncbi:MAG: FAD/NAD(P)-binding protein, partial [Ferruginibacter sp.]